MPHGIQRAVAEAGITVEAVARLLQIHRNSAANKLYGRTAFTVGEAIRLRNAFFPGQSIEDLFEEKEASQGGYPD